MSKKPLSQSNKYLRDPKIRNESLRQGVISSSAIEGISANHLQNVLPKIETKIKNS